MCAGAGVRVPVEVGESGGRDRSSREKALKQPGSWVRGKGGSHEQARAHARARARAHPPAALLAWRRPRASTPAAHARRAPAPRTGRPAPARSRAGSAAGPAGPARNHATQQGPWGAAWAAEVSCRPARPRRRAPNAVQQARQVQCRRQPDGPEEGSRVLAAALESKKRKAAKAEKRKGREPRRPSPCLARGAGDLPSRQHQLRGLQRRQHAAQLQRQGAGGAEAETRRGSVSAWPCDHDCMCRRETVKRWHEAPAPSLRRRAPAACNGKAGPVPTQRNARYNTRYAQPNSEQSTSPLYPQSVRVLLHG